MQAQATREPGYSGDHPVVFRKHKVVLLQFWDNSRESVFERVRESSSKIAPKFPFLHSVRHPTTLEDAVHQEGRDLMATCQDALEAAQFFVNEHQRGDLDRTVHDVDGALVCADFLLPFSPQLQARIRAGKAFLDCLVRLEELEASFISTLVWRNMTMIKHARGTGHEHLVDQVLTANQ